MTAKLWHRWLGLVLGIWLVLIGLSGAVLLYKNPLLRWQYPQLQGIEPVADISAWGALMDQLQQDPAFRYAKLPAEDALWLEAVTHTDSHYYYDHQGQLRLVRAAHSDVLSWLYDFHLHLLAGKDGRQVMGYLGLAILVMLITGLVQWWPRQVRRQLWRLPWRKPDLRTLRQWHTSLASLFSPLQLLILLTALAVIFSAQVRPALNWLFNDPVVVKSDAQPMVQPLSQSDWTEVLVRARSYWPQMEFRLLSFRGDAEQAYRLRAKSPNEWHPNGRSTLLIDAVSYQILDSQNADELGRGQRLYNLMYPLHMAAVGGQGYKLLLLFGGVLPLILFISGLWYYLLRRRK